MRQAGLTALFLTLCATAVGARASPVIESIRIVSTPADTEAFAYAAGETVRLEVAYDAAIDVRGDPRLLISVGTLFRSALFTDRPDARTVAFEYVVATEDFDASGIAPCDGHWCRYSVIASLTGSDPPIVAAGTDTAVSGPYDPSTFAASPAHLANGALPSRIASVRLISIPADGAVFRRGAALDFEVVFTRPVSTPSPGHLRLPLSVALEPRTAHYHAHVDELVYYFRYRVAEGDTSAFAPRVCSERLLFGPCSSSSAGAITSFVASLPVDANGLTADVSLPAMATPPAYSIDASEPAPTGGICGRTHEVRQALLAKLPQAADCSAVTPAMLRGISTLDLSNLGISALRFYDFDNLANMRVLDLSGNALRTLPSGVFRRVVSLEELDLSGNPLPATPVPSVALGAGDALSPGDTVAIAVERPVDDAWRANVSHRWTATDPHGAPATVADEGADPFVFTVPADSPAGVWTFSVETSAPPGAPYAARATTTRDVAVPYIVDLRVETRPQRTVGFTLDELIGVRVEFNEAVSIRGSPVLYLDVGGVMRPMTFVYALSTPWSAYFVYPVAADDADADGVVPCHGTPGCSDALVLPAGAGVVSARFASLPARLDYPAVAPDAAHRIASEVIVAPAALSEFSAEPVRGGLKISWGPPPSPASLVDGYELCLHAITVATCQWRPLVSGHPDQLETTIIELDADTPMAVSARATGPGGAGPATDTVVVTPLPATDVSIEAARTSAIAGVDSLRFTVSRTPVTSSALAVALSVDGTGVFTGSDPIIARTVIIPPGAASQDLLIARETLDPLAPVSGTVTASPLATAHYAVVAPRSASVTVLSASGAPPFTAAFVQRSYRFSEAASNAAVDLVISGAAHLPLPRSTLYLDLRLPGADAGDVTAPHPVVSVAPGDFTASSSGPFAAISVPLALVDDALFESEERVPLLLSVHPSMPRGAVGLANPDLSPCGASCRAELVIEDDDSLADPALALLAFDVPALYLDEAAAGSYTVRLTAAPSAPVTIALTPTVDAPLTVWPQTLTLSASDWDTGRLVTVTTLVDDDATDDLLLIEHAGTLAGHPLNASLALHVRDTVAPPVAPAPPAGLSLEAANGALALAWTPPGPGTSPITHYEVQHREIPGAWSPWTLVSGGAQALRHTFVSLAPERYYSARVRAVSLAGAGPAGETLSAFLPAATSVSVHAARPAAIAGIDRVAFTVERSGSTGAALDVTLRVQDPTGVLATPHPGGLLEVSLPAGTASLALDLPVRAGTPALHLVEVLALTVEPSPAYSLAPAATASTTVHFHPAPLAVVLTPPPGPLVEGTTSTWTLDATRAPGLPTPSVPIGVVFTHRADTPPGLAGPAAVHVAFAPGLYDSAGRQRRVFTVSAVDDALALAPRTVSGALNLADPALAPVVPLSVRDAPCPYSGCAFDLTIADDDGTSLVFSTTFLHLVEGTPSTYTVRLSRSPAARADIAIAAPPGFVVTPAKFHLDASTWDTGRSVSVFPNVLTQTRSFVASFDLVHALTVAGAPAIEYTLPVRVDRSDTAAAVPGAPNVTGVVSHGRTGTLHWTPPDEDGGAGVLGYEYDVATGHEPFSSDWTAVPQSHAGGVNERSYTLIDLAPDLGYRVRMRARNRAGAGSASVTSSFFLWTPSQITIAPLRSPATPGLHTLAFDVRRTLRLTKPVEVAVSLTQTHPFVSVTDHVVAFGIGEDHAVLVLELDAEATAPPAGAHSIAATIAPGADYESTAPRALLDLSFPPSAPAVLTVAAPAAITEGDPPGRFSVTASIDATLGLAQETFTVGFALDVPRHHPAGAHRLEPSALSFAPGDFTANGTAYTATKHFDLVIADDPVYDPPFTATVEAVVPARFLAAVRFDDTPAQCSGASCVYAVAVTDDEALDLRVAPATADLFLGQTRDFVLGLSQANAVSAEVAFDLSFSGIPTLGTDYAVLVDGVPLAYPHRLRIAPGAAWVAFSLHAFSESRLTGETTLRIAFSHGEATLAALDVDLIHPSVRPPVRGPDLAGPFHVGLPVSAASVGVPSPLDPDAPIAYQWLVRSSDAYEDVAGATSDAYTPVLADVGRLLALRLSGTDAQSLPVVVIVDATSAVALRPVVLSVSEPSEDLAEGASATLTYRLDRAALRTLSVPLTALPGDGADADDFSLSSTALAFDADDVEATVLVTAADDALDDDGETLIVTPGTLPAGVSADPGGLARTFALIDDDLPALTVAFAEATAAVEEGAAPVELEVRLSTAPERSLSIPVAPADPTAAALAGLVVDPSTLVFGSEAEHAIVRLSAPADTLDEPDRAVAIELGPLPDGVTAGLVPTVSVTVSDPTPDPITLTLSAEPPVLVEGGDGAKLRVHAAPAPTTPLTVSLDVVYASGGSDADLLAPVPASVVVAPGETVVEIPLHAADDATVETVETATVSLSVSDARGVLGDPASIELRIEDNDAVEREIAFAADAYTATEGGTDATVTLTIDPAASGTDTSVALSVSAASTADAADYAALPSHVDFADGATSATLTVSAVDDALDDGEATLVLALAPRSAGTRIGARGTTAVALVDDDTGIVGVTVEPSALTLAEGGAGVAVRLAFTAPLAEAATVSITPTFGAGADAEDFVSLPATLDVPAGASAHTFVLEAADDAVVESSETVSVVLACDDARLRFDGSASFSLTLEDNDRPPHVVTFAETPVAAHEGGADAVLVASVSPPISAGERYTIDLIADQAVDDDAAELDYTGLPPSLTFSENARVIQFSVRAVDDDADDDDEALAVRFGALPSGFAAGAVTEVIVALVDDDHPTVTASFERSGYTLAEGGATVDVALVLDRDPERELAFALSASGDPAGAVADVLGLPAVARFAAGETRALVALAQRDDAAYAPERTVTLSVHPLPAGVRAGTYAEAALGLGENDLRQVTATLLAEPLDLAEGATATVTVSLDAAPDRPLTLPVEVRYLSGADASDVSGVPASVSFGAHDTEVRFDVAATDDTDDDDGESVEIALGTLPARVLAGDRRAARIALADDDHPVITAGFAPAHRDVTAAGTEAVFELVLSAAPERPLTLRVETVFTLDPIPPYASPGAVTFGASDTRAALRVPRPAFAPSVLDQVATLRFVDLPEEVSAAETAAVATARFAPVQRSVTAGFGPGTFNAVEAGPAVQIPIVLDRAPGVATDLDVRYAFVDGTDSGARSEAADWVALPTTVRVGASETTATLALEAAFDAADDDGESVVVSLSSADSLVTIDPGASRATVTVLDVDPPALTVALSAHSVALRETGAVITLEASVSEAPERDLTVPIEVVPGTAEASDYTLSSPSFHFGATELTSSVVFSPVPDRIDEPDETLVLRFPDVLPRGVSAGAPDAVTLTIVDDDERAIVAEPGAFTVVEGSSAGYTLRLASEPTAAVSVTPVVPAGAGARVTTGTLRFTSSDWTEPQQVTVALEHDADAIAGDAFELTHTVVTGGDYAAAQPPVVTVTPVEDDAASLYVADARAPESAGVLSFEVRLTAAASDAVGFAYETAPVSALAGQDYTHAAGTASIPAGDVVIAIEVPVLDDTAHEPDETLRLVVRPADSDLRSGALSALGTIVDDDHPPVVLSVLVPQRVDEGGEALVDFRLDRAPQRTLPIPFSLAFHDGADASDARAAHAEVRFGPEDTTAQSTVHVSDDTHDDDGEAFSVLLGTLPEGVSIPLVPLEPALVRIVDDDHPTLVLSVSADATALAEGGAPVVLTAELDAAPGRDITVPVVLTPAQGASAADYALLDTGFTFVHPATRAQVRIRAVDDTQDDDGERVTVSLGTLPEGVSAGAGTPLTLTLVDDDGPGAVLSFADTMVSAAEGTRAAIRIQSSQPATATALLPIAITASGADTSDYRLVTDPVVLPGGATGADILIDVLDDDAEDESESLALAFGVLPPGFSAAPGAGALLTLLDTDRRTVRISFDSSAYAVAEGEPPIEVAVALDRAPGRALHVPVTLDPPGVLDVSGLSGTPAGVAFAPDATQATFTVARPADDQPLPASAVALAFAALPERVLPGAVATAVVGVSDDDPVPVRLRFDPAVLDLVEGGAPGVLAVRSDSPLARRLAVTLAVIGENKVRPDDLAPFDATLVFAPGSTQATVSLKALDDGDSDPNEHLRLQLVGVPDWALAPVPNEAMVRIRDDDAPAPAPIAVSFGASRATLAPGAELALGLEFAAPLPAALEIPLRFDDPDALLSDPPDAVMASAGATRAPFGLVATRFEAPAPRPITVSLGPLPALLVPGAPATLALEPAPDPRPMVGLSAPDSVREGDPITVSLMRTGSAADPLTVELAVEAPAGTIAGDATRTGAFAPGDPSLSVALETVGDRIAGPPRIALVRLVPATPYRLLDQSSARVTVVDDDAAGFVHDLIRPTQPLDEGTSVVRTLELASEPVAPVTVSLSTGDAALATVSPASLRWTGADWSTPKAFTISAPADAAGGSTAHTALHLSASGGGYDAVALEWALRIEDATPLLQGQAVRALSAAVVSTPPDGTAYRAGDALDIEVVYDAPIRVERTPALSLSLARQRRPAGYVSGSGTAKLRFRYTAVPGDADADGVALAGYDLSGGLLFGPDAHAIAPDLPVLSGNVPASFASSDAPLLWLELADPVVVAGGLAEIMLRTNRPSSAPLLVSLRVTVPPGLSGGGDRSVRLAPDADRRLVRVPVPGGARTGDEVVVSFLDTSSGYAVSGGPVQIMVRTPGDTATIARVRIDGSGRVGEALTAHVEMLDDPDGMLSSTLAWSWVRDDGAQLLRTGDAYLPSHHDIGHAVAARLTLRDDAGEVAVIDSPWIAISAAAAPPLRLPGVVVEAADAGARVRWSVPAMAHDAAADTIEHRLLAGGAPGPWRSIALATGSGVLSLGPLPNGVAHTLEMRLANAHGPGRARSVDFVPDPSGAGLCARAAAVVAAVAAALGSDAGCAWIEAAELAAIVRLDLDGRALRTLAASDWTGFTALRQLQAAGVGLASIEPGALEALSALESLDVARNDLHGLPLDVLAVHPTLAHLDVAANPLPAASVRLSVAHLSLGRSAGAAASYDVQITRPFGPGPSALTLAFDGASLAAVPAALSFPARGWFRPVGVAVTRLVPAPSAPLRIAHAPLGDPDHVLATIEVRPPLLSSVPARAITATVVAVDPARTAGLGVGDRLRATIEFPEPVHWVDGPDAASLSLGAGTDRYPASRVQGASAPSRRATFVHVLERAEDADRPLHVRSGVLTLGADHAETADGDALAPQVAARPFVERLSVALGPPTSVTVQMSEPVAVGDSPGPSVALTTGDGTPLVASYRSLSDARVLLLTVPENSAPATPSHVSVAADALAAPGGVRGAASGLPAVLAHPAAQASRPVPDGAHLILLGATATEGTDSQLEFRLFLSGASRDHPVTVLYATEDDTAVGGLDFVHSVGSAVLPAGEVTTSIFVPVLDDDHDEGSERMRLLLTATHGLSHRDLSAYGTIVNTDPLPRTWVSRLGRDLADELSGLVSERRPGPSGAASLTLGGQPFGPVRTAPHTVSEPDPFGAERAATERERDMTLAQLLAGSAFTAPLGGQAGDPPAAVFWGRGSERLFSTDSGDLRTTGASTRAWLGVEHAREHWLAGAALMQSWSRGTYDGVGTGSVRADLSGVFPYFAAELEPGHGRVWGAAGLATGAIESDTLELDARLTPATLTGGHVLGLSPWRALEWTLSTRAMLVSNTIEPHDGPSASFTDTYVSAHLDASGEFEPDWGAVRPSAGLGLHAERTVDSAIGVEVRGGLGYTTPGERMTLDFEGAARRFSATRLTEWSASVALSLRSRPGPYGWRLSLAPRLSSIGTDGGPARETPAGVGWRFDGLSRPGSLAAEAGYTAPLAFSPAFEGGPVLGYDRRDGGDVPRIGYRVRTRDRAFSLNLDLDHRAAPRAGVRWRW